MSNKESEETAKRLYKYIKTKDGEMPEMRDPKNRKALEDMLNKRYLTQEECCSPQTTTEGDRWAYNK